jgi:hypothetical protein
MLGNQQAIVVQLNQEWQNKPEKMDGLAARLMGINNGVIEGAFLAAMHDQPLNNENNAHAPAQHQ